MSYFDKVKVQDGAATWTTSVDAQGALKIATANRLVGNNFQGTNFDANIWTATVAASGTISQASNVVTMQTGTSANGGYTFVSNKVARFNYGNNNVYQGTHRFTDTGTANNKRKFGVFDPVSGDGFFFQLNGTTFSVGYSVSGVETLVNSGSFNGDGFQSGQSYTVTTNAQDFKIQYTIGGAQWFIRGVPIHTEISTTSIKAGNFTLPIYVSNVNTGGSTTNVGLETWAVIVYRLGEIYNNPLSARITGAGTTTVKYSAGHLNFIIVGNPGVAGDITFYDNTAGSGTIILKITTSGAANIAYSLPIDIPFNTGLTVVTTGAAQDFVISYE